MLPLGGSGGSGGGSGSPNPHAAAGPAVIAPDSPSKAGLSISASNRRNGNGSRGALRLGSCLGCSAAPSSPVLAHEPLSPLQAGALAARLGTGGSLSVPVFVGSPRWLVLHRASPPGKCPAPPQLLADGAECRLHFQVCNSCCSLHVFQVMAWGVYSASSACLLTRRGLAEPSLFVARGCSLSHAPMRRRGPPWCPTTSCCPAGTWCLVCSAGRRVQAAAHQSPPQHPRWLSSTPHPSWSLPSCAPCTLWCSAGCAFTYQTALWRWPGSVQLQCGGTRMPAAVALLPPRSQRAGGGGCPSAACSTACGCEWQCTTGGALWGLQLCARWQRWSRRRDSEVSLPSGCAHCNTVTAERTAHVALIYWSDLCRPALLHTVSHSELPCLQGSMSCCCLSPPSWPGCPATGT